MAANDCRSGRGTPHGATPPTPPGTRVTYCGGSIGLSLGGDLASGEDRLSRNSGCTGPIGPPDVRTCARTPSANRRRPPHGTWTRHASQVGEHTWRLAEAEVAGPSDEVWRQLLISCSRQMPHVRRVMSRACVLNLSRVFGAMRRSLPSFEMLNPRNLRSSARATALFTSLTLSRSFRVRNQLIEAMTRSPARRLRT